MDCASGWLRAGVLPQQRRHINTCAWTGVRGAAPAHFRCRHIGRRRKAIRSAAPTQRGPSRAPAARLRPAGPRCTVRARARSGGEGAKRVPACGLNVIRLNLASMSAASAARRAASASVSFTPASMTYSNSTKRPAPRGKSSRSAPSSAASGYLHRDADPHQNITDSRLRAEEHRNYTSRYASMCARREHLPAAASL
jgi:hypothetical protein